MNIVPIQLKFSVIDFVEYKPWDTVFTNPINVFSQLTTSNFGKMRDGR